MKWALAIFLLTLVSVPGQDAPSPADLRYQEGYRLLRAAEAGGNTALQRIEGLRACADELRAASALDPDHYLARALLAQSLFGLARELTDAGERRAAADEAHRQFAAAAQLPAADWRIFNSWGRFLTYRATALSSNAVERLATLQQARQQFEKADHLVRWSTDRATVDGTYGQCLYQLAMNSNDETEKQFCLTESVRRLDSALKVLTAATDAAVLRTRANALLALGEQQRDRSLMQQALSRLQELPDSAETRYQLARAHALLGNEEQALNELRASLQAGADTNLVESAKSDAAFAALRKREEFAKALVSRLNAPSAAGLLQEAQSLIERADQQAEARGELLKRAVELLAEAARLQPDVIAPLNLWAQTLAQLAQSALPRTDRVGFAMQALTRYSAAAGHRDADWRNFFAWGEFLEYASENLADTEQQRTDWLSEAALKFQAGLKRAKAPGERRVLQRELAACMVEIAERLRASAERMALVQNALQLCAELGRDTAATDQPRLNAIWGRALVQSGAANRDRMQLRLAVEKLAAALETDPRHAELRYRLVTAYALLDNKEQALRHLRLCLEADSAGLFRQRASEDANLNALRSTPEFNELIPPKPPPSIFSQPRLSD